MGLLCIRPDVLVNNEPLPFGTVVAWDDRIAVLDYGLTLAQLRQDARYALQWQQGTPAQPYQAARQRLDPRGGFRAGAVGQGMKSLWNKAC